jgi:predicted metal-dependent hydrolase
LSEPSGIFSSAVNVEVRRSTRRRKTVEARLVDGTLRVAIPATMSKSEETHWVEVMRQRFERRKDASEINLAVRARHLAGRYELPEPTEIVWSTRQATRWGSCSVDTGRVRISNRLAAYPPWVIDYVIVHELAHLIEAGHNARFWKVVNRYPLAERARGYLLARGDMGD